MATQNDGIFEDRIVLVTGAGSGIGRAIAHRFAELGAVILLTDIVQDRLSQVSEELAHKGCEARVFAVDVASRSQMENMAQNVLTEFGHIDVLINNAGVALGGELAETTLEQFHSLMNVNFWGVVHGVHYFLPSMLERKSGHIVNISSINGLAPFPFNGPYNASKFAVVGYTGSLRMELAPYGIGVTAVCPGLIDTRITKDRRGSKASNPKTQLCIEKFECAMAKRGADPAMVAQAIPRAILKNKAIVRVPLDSSIFYWVHTLFPRLYNRIVNRIVEGKPVPFL